MFGAAAQAGRVVRERVLRAGEALLGISCRLVLVESTLARWLWADRKALALAPKFRSVSIVEAEQEVRGETVRLTTPAGYTKSVGTPRTMALTMAFNLLDMAQRRWRRLNVPHLLPPVRASATFVDGVLMQHGDDPDRNEQGA